MFDAASITHEESVERYSATTEFRRELPEVRAVALSPAKRLFDIVAAGCALLLFLPLLAVVMLAIRMETPGAAIFRQRRTGYRGQVFTILKFRTMTVAEDCAAVRQATRNDERVTQVGALLRKLSIDELPQLWNVMRGDMSIVGPRPERPQFVEQLAEKIRYYNLRHCVKPGLAGWAQLRYPYGASEADAREKLKYDLFYVKNNGMLFDLMILIQTVEVVLFGRGVR